MLDKIDILKNKLLSSYNRTTNESYKQTLEGLIKKLVNLSKAVQIEAEAADKAIHETGNKIKHLFTMSVVLSVVPKYAYTYYDSGTLSYQMPYYKGLPHGIAKGFYPCGTVKSECIWNSGQWVEEKFYNVEGDNYLTIKNYEAIRTDNTGNTIDPIKID